MKKFWYATLVTITSLVLGTLVSQSFGADRGGRSISGSIARSAGQVRSGGLNTGVSRKFTGSQGLGGFKPPVVKPLNPVNPKPIVGPLKPIGPFKPPVGPIKPPTPIGPIKPPVVGPIGPIKPPVGPISPLPPICPPHCPPQPCPPHCPPYNPGHCGPWYPLPGWFGCYRPCQPICVTLPTYVGPVVTTPVVTETVVVETEAPAVAATESAAPVDPITETVGGDEKPMQVPVGATLQLNEKTLGEAKGQVLLQMGAITVPAQINEWKAEQVNVTLPAFGLSAPTKADLWLVRPNGQVVNKLAVELIPAQAPVADAAEPVATTAAVTRN